MTTAKKPQPSDPSSTYLKMQPRWAKADALLGGTETMRAAGKEFMPQHARETEENYRRRLEATTLLPMTEIVLEALVGRPFSKPIVLGDDVPEAIVALAEDVDRQGNNLQAFCRAWFREGWAKGFSHVLVDHPVVPPVEPGAAPRTLADDRAESLTPFLRRIAPEDLIAAYGEVVDGRDVLTHVRFREASIVRDGWGERVEERIRVLEPGRWETWVPTPDGKDWVLEEDGETTVDRITLVTFYAGKKEGLHLCKPPLMDLMDLNITHWQSSSDQRNTLTVARFPILAGAGVPADAEVVVGPNRFLTTEAPEGKWYYVEHTGAALEAGDKDLSNLRDQMASFGAEFLRAQPGTETATARALDSAEGISYLQATAIDFQDAVEQALALLALWMNEEDGGSASVYTGFTGTQAAVSDLEQVLKLRAARDISRKATLLEFKRRGTLSDEFDVDEDAKQREQEAEDDAAAGGGLGGMFTEQGDRGDRGDRGDPPEDPVA